MLFVDIIKEAKKGIPYSCTLNIDDFKETLYGANKEKHKVEVRSLKLNQTKQMTRTTMYKLGLSDIHCKLGVQEDRVTCLPLKENSNYI